MTYNCLFPDTLSAEEKAALGDANVTFEHREPIIGDVLALAGIRFKVSGITFNLEAYPENSLGARPGTINYQHITTLLALTKFPG